MDSTVKAPAFFTQAERQAAAHEAAWALPSPGRVGMFSLIAAESAIFVIFIVAYAFYVGKSLSGPTPSVLHPPIFISACLLSSSATMELAVRSLKRGKTSAFTAWWLLTIALGAIFLVGTGLEWRHLMVDEGLTIATNLFGTTFYSLIGLHGFHVTVGLILMTTVAALIAIKKVSAEHTSKLELIALYWHFVDSVWVVVFTLVYVIGRSKWKRTRFKSAQRAKDVVSPSSFPRPRQRRSSRRSGSP